MRRIALAGPTDFAGFRAAARQLLRQGAAPDGLSWDSSPQGRDLFCEAERADDVAARDLGAFRTVPTVSRAFLDIASAAALHSDETRFSLIYRLLWRLVDEPRLMSLASDADVARLGDLAKAVRRDIHKMHAFVRFRQIDVPDAPGGEAYVAWYEPDHHVVEAAAPFFAKRFASLHWTILSPECCVHWTGARLVFAPGANKSAAPTEDRLEDLWRSYYANIFNPARVNPDAMRAEMPVHFWRNLPEASLIRDLVATAPARTAKMIQAMPSVPVARRGADHAPLDPERPRDDLDAIAKAVVACRACSLWEHTTQAVPGEGPKDASLMLVGEQPGDQEDIAGHPFVGPAGQVLEKALAQAGISRSRTYVTNAVKHFKFAPRGKRRLHKRPDVGEIRACSSWLASEVAIVDPQVLVLLGASAAQAVLGRSVAVTRARGVPFQLDDGRTAVIATHPSYILRLQDRAEADAAFDALVRDLTTAASLLKDA